MPLRRKLARHFAIALCVCAAALGCMRAPLEELRERREAYERCVEDWGADHERCIALHEELQDAQGRYRDPAPNAADDGWGAF